MKWTKLGQIFDFKNSPFSNKYISHAQSPQAIVFDDYVRVYFTTRKEDGDFFVSVPQYVDFNKDFSKIINYSKDEIIPLGNLGCFDEHGIFPFSPIKINDEIKAYTSGWTRRVSVSVDSGIGLAISLDSGNTFNKLGDGPILTSSLKEPFLVIDAFVRFFNNQYYMFYIYGERWIYDNSSNKAERVYKITYATSIDGINWVKSGVKIIEDVLNQNECQALPAVIKIGDRYIMYFCYRDAFNFRTDKQKSYKLGFAYSHDLKSWIRDDKNAGIEVSKDGFDSEMMCYPNLFEMDNDYYLLYNGNKFGKDGFGIAKLNKNNL
jgi:hypothetical protein